MTGAEGRKAVLEWLERRMTDWDAMASGLSEAEALEAVDALTGVAVLAARAATYLGSRARGNNHGHAVGRQNARARVVRRALGYTVARSDVTF